MVAAQAPHHLSCSIGNAELAHVGAVHVVVEVYAADALADVGTCRAVVGERGEVVRRSLAGVSAARLGVHVVP